MPVNKVHAVTTIDLVAVELATTVDHLLDVALGTQPEDGLIWAYSINDEHGIMAFTEDGIEHLRHLIEENQSGSVQRCRGPQRMLALNVTLCRKLESQELTESTALERFNKGPFMGYGLRAFVEKK